MKSDKKRVKRFPAILKTFYNIEKAFSEVYK